MYMRVALDQKLVFLSLQLKYKIKYLELDHDSLITMKLSLDRGVLCFVYMVSFPHPCRNTNRIQLGRAHTRTRSGRLLTGLDYTHFIVSTWTQSGPKTRPFSFLKRLPISWPKLWSSSDTDVLTKTHAWSSYWTECADINSLIFACL